MPVYEYKCAACGTPYEVFHKGREVMEDVVCPSCNSTDHRKLMSAPVVSTTTRAANDSSCGSGECCGGTCGMN